MNLTLCNSLILSWLFLHFVNSYILFHQVLGTFSNHIQSPDFSSHLLNGILDLYPPAVWKVVLLILQKGIDLGCEPGSCCGTSSIEANAPLFGLF